MRFSLERKEIELRVIPRKPSRVINSNNMIKLLKEGHYGILGQLCSLDRIEGCIKKQKGNNVD